MDDTPRRLSQLARILSDARPYGDAPAPDALEHLHRVRLQRIQNLTAHLDNPAARGVDDVDAVAMRLLLDQYMDVVVQLRAAARAGAQTLAGVADAVRADRRRIEERSKQRETPPVSAAPSDR